MSNTSNSFDLARIVFSLLIIGCLIITCYWIIEPFLIAFTWASMIVIATWNLMLYIQSWLWNKRILAVIVMLLLIILICIIPVAIVLNSIISSSSTIIEWIKNSNNWQIPSLNRLNDIPIIGHTAQQYWQEFTQNNNAELLANIKPYLGKFSSWFFLQLINVGHFIIHAFLMLIFSAVLYVKGESIALLFQRFILRLSPIRGKTSLTLAAQSIRAVALGVVVTALIQSIIAGTGLFLLNINFAALLTIGIFICCLAQIGPLLILIPCCAWLYWYQQSISETIILLILSIIVASLDNIIRPILIRKGANLPLSLILIGVIGGLISFGMLGLFIGPVVLAVSYRLIEVWSNPVTTMIDRP